MTHTSCIENKRLEIRPSFVKFDTNVYDFYSFTYYMQVFSIQKTKRAFHQLKTVHRLQKAYIVSLHGICQQFWQPLAFNSKTSKTVSQILKVRIKSYWGAAQGIPTRRGKAKTHDETNDSSYLLLPTARPDFSTARPATYPVINIQEKLKGKGKTWWRGRNCHQPSKFREKKFQNIGLFALSSYCPN